METNTTYVALTRPWAELPAACSVFGTLSVAGDNHALAQCTGLAVGATPAMGRRLAASSPAPAMTTTKPLAAASAGELLPVNGIRKQNNVHKTQLSAGGYGAMGSHPEREPA